MSRDRMSRSALRGAFRAPSGAGQDTFRIGVSRVPLAAATAVHLGRVGARIKSPVLHPQAFPPLATDLGQIANSVAVDDILDLLAEAVLLDLERYPSSGNGPPRGNHRDTSRSPSLRSCAS